LYLKEYLEFFIWTRSRRKTYGKNPSIDIQNFDLACESTVKLLGIDIDYQLNFDAHISTICRKASQQLNILKRLGSYLNRLNKLTIFHTFILSNFNFCPLAWHFCTNKNSKKLEKVHERALNKRGPRIDPWGTPLWMSAQLLSTLLTLICCFLFDK
jgi:hypothetical protein